MEIFDPISKRFLMDVAYAYYWNLPFGWSRIINLISFSTWKILRKIFIPAMDHLHLHLLLEPVCCYIVDGRDWNSVLDALS